MEPPGEVGEPHGRPAAAGEAVCLPLERQVPVTHQVLEVSELEQG